MRQDPWMQACAAVIAFAVWQLSPSTNETATKKGPAVAGWSATDDRPAVEVAAATAPASLSEWPVTKGPAVADPPAANNAPVQSQGGDCVANDLKAVAARTGQLARMAEITKLAGLGGASAHVDTQLTIFAPTDAAFAALPESFRTAILKPENRAQLQDMLLHHVILGKYTTRRLLRASAKHYGVKAVDGTSIEFTIRHGLDVNGAKLLSSDLEASNGVLHVIDKVLVPAKVLAAIAAQSGNKTASAAAE